MKEPRKQHLSEAVAGLISTIVKMMLGLLRARGLRGLLELPALFRFVRDLRRLAEEFATLFAAFKAGTLPLPLAAPASLPVPESLPVPASLPVQESPRPAAAPRARAPCRAARPRRRALPC